MEGSLLPDDHGDTEYVNTMTFKGSAIRGSSLLNTFNDIRPHIQRGTNLLIDGVTYQTATTGEWNSNSVQLTSDYTGETNFSVNIVLPSSSLSPKRKKGNPTKKSKLAPQEKKKALSSQTNQDKENKSQPNISINDQHKRPAPQNKRSQRQNIANVLENKNVIHATGDTPTRITAELNLNRFKNNDTKLKRSNTTVKRVNNSNKDVDQEEQSTDANSQSLPKSRSSVPSSRQVKPRVKRASTLVDEGAAASMRRGSFTQAGPVLNKIAHHHSPSHNTNDEAETAIQHQLPVTEETLIERRKAAAERVKRKLKEDQERIEKAAAAKEAELRAVKDASELKARELQARTAKRVEQYKEDCLRKEHHAKAVAQYEQQERERINQEFLSAARFQKMKEIRKEAKQRLNQVAQDEYRQAVREAEERQKQLSERHKKYDVNTTFLPKLDGGASQASSQRRNGQTSTPPGRVVKNLGRELAQLEADSASFPEEPVLRSRSARQVARSKHAHPQQSASKQSHLAQVAPSVRRDDSLPVLSARGCNAKISNMPASRPPKDEDEWSDDEPDALLLGKDRYIHPAALPTTTGQDTDGNYLEDDSLDMGGNQGNEEYGRLDDEMEMELFGELQGSGYIKNNSKQVVAVSKPIKNPIFVSPTAKNLSLQQEKKRYPAQRGGDETASDCSELTDDSMLNRFGTRKTKASTAAAKMSAITTGQQQMQRTPQKTPPAVAGIRLPRPSDRSAPTMPPLAQLPKRSPAPMQQQQQDQVMFKSSYNYAQIQQQPQQQVLLQHAPPPLPANIQHAASHNSNNSSSPSKSKSSSRPMFRKLKPIPISVPYRPVPASNI